MLNNKPSPPTKPDYDEQYISHQFHCRESGICRLGTFIKSFIPETPYRDPSSGHRKVVIYMHGFALGASKIYHSHLIHLVKQGFYVFYPVYQRGFCQEKSSFLANVCQMALAVLNPLPIDAVGWNMAAIYSVKTAYAEVEELDSAVDTYVFGHSLGGLQALSWLYYATESKVPAYLLPQQVVVADPIPSSDKNIPPPIRQILNLLCFFKTKVDIQTTGLQLTVPVAILHGKQDTIVRPDDWREPFQYIASQHKKFYLSLTDDHGHPTLHADHMQATVYSGFFPDWLARSVLGGVGVEDNLNWRYIWSALDQVVTNHCRADQLRFDLGKWSDGVEVLSPECFLPEVTE